MLKFTFNQFDWFIVKQEMAKKTSAICNFTTNCTIVIWNKQDSHETETHLIIFWCCRCKLWPDSLGLAQYSISHPKGCPRYHESGSISLLPLRHPVQIKKSIFCKRHSCTTLHRAKRLVWLWFTWDGSFEKTPSSVDRRATAGPEPHRPDESSHHYL